MKYMKNEYEYIKEEKKRKLRNEAQLIFLTKVRGVWIYDQTQVRVCDTRLLKQIRTSEENERESLTNLGK